MAKKIVFTTYFRNSLQEILNFISLDSLIIAEGFRKNCIIKIENFAYFPKIGIEIEKDIRKYQIHKNYNLYYKILENKILILSIRNVKRKTKL